MASSFLTILDHTQRSTTLGRTRLDEWSARRKDLYLTTHIIHRKQTSIPAAEFEPTTPARERLQTHVLDRTATGVGELLLWYREIESGEIKGLTETMCSRHHSLTFYILRDLTCDWNVGNVLVLAPISCGGAFLLPCFLNSCISGASVSLFCANLRFTKYAKFDWLAYT